MWNLICGIPFLIPQFTYGDHRGHHVNREYGTADDAEYLMIVEADRLLALHAHAPLLVAARVFSFAFAPHAAYMDPRRHSPLGLAIPEPRPGREPRVHYLCAQLAKSRIGECKRRVASFTLSG